MPDDRRTTFVKPLAVTAAALLVTQVPLLLGYGPGKNPAFALCLLALIPAWLMTRRENPFSPLDIVLAPPVFPLCCAVFLMASITLVVVDYHAIHYSGFDTGVFANLAANAWHNGRYYSSILGAHGFGDHFSPVLLLAAPLLAVKSTFLWLPFLKVAAFFACPLVLLALGRAVLGRGDRLAILPALLWITNQYVNAVLKAEFQPSGLAPPLILLAFLFAIQGRTLLMLVALAALLGIKEHLPLIWVSLGVFMIVFLRRRLLGSALIAGGVAAGCLIYFVVMPSFAGEYVPPHAVRFAPAALIGVKLAMLFKVMASVAFLPLLAPSTLLFIIPAFGIQLVSGARMMLQLSFHYQDIAMPVVFVGLTYGLAASRRMSWPARLTPCRRADIVWAAALLLLALNCRYPMETVRRHWPAPQAHVLVAEIERAEPPSDGRTVWVLDALAPYYFAHAGLRSILTADAAFEGDGKRTVITAAGVNSYPLSAEDALKLAQNLDRAVQSGRCRKRGGLKLLTVVDCGL